MRKTIKQSLLLVVFLMFVGNLVSASSLFSSGQIIQSTFKTSLFETLYQGTIEEKGENSFLYNIKHYAPGSSAFNGKVSVLKKGVEIPESPFSLNSNKGKYQKKVNVSSLGTDYNYYFEGNKEKLRYPRRGNLSGPVVSKNTRSVKASCIDDTYIIQLRDRNYDFLDRISVKNGGRDDRSRIGFIKFDLSSFSQQTVVDSSELCVYRENEHDNENISFKLYPTKENWEEETLNWDKWFRWYNSKWSEWCSSNEDCQSWCNIIESREPKDYYDNYDRFYGVFEEGEAVATKRGFTGNSWNCWEGEGLDSSVQNLIGGNNYGWTIISSKYGTTFNSKEANSHEPYLKITYSTVPAPLINEVYYDVENGDEGYNEWIELYNPAPSTIDLADWKICDDNSCDTLPSKTIEPESYLLITGDSDTWNYWKDVPESTNKISLEGYIGSGLNNSGERIVLKSFNGDAMDSVSYGNKETEFKDVGEGNSFQRKAPGWNTSGADDWKELKSPTPGRH